MKKIVMTIVLVCGASATLFAPPVPNEASKNNAVHTDGTEQEGAPIGTATALLLTLGAGYTGVKVYAKRKKETQDNQQEE